MTEGVPKETHQLAALSNKPQFIFVRYWPGFSDDFPYADFAACTDEVIDTHLWAALRAELARREVSDSEIASICEHEEGYPGAQFVLLAETIGWIPFTPQHRWEGVGNPRLCSRLVCIGVAGAIEEAEAANKELTWRAQLETRKGHCTICKKLGHVAMLCPYSNLKFTYAACDHFDLAVQVRAQLTHERLLTGGAVDNLERHAMMHSHVFDAFHRQWTKTDLSCKEILTTSLANVRAVTGELDENRPAELGGYAANAEISSRFPAAISSGKDSDLKDNTDASVDYISFDDVARLLGHTKKKAVQNAAIDWRKDGITITDPCSYAKLRPLVIAKWQRKKHVFPPSLEEAKLILKNLR